MMEDDVRKKSIIDKWVFLGHPDPPEPFNCHVRAQSALQTLSKWGGGTMGDGIVVSDEKYVSLFKEFWFLFG